MVPLPQILAELVMALGAALFAANAYALLRPRFDAGRAVEGAEKTKVQAKGRVLVNIFIGLLVFVWGLASFISGSNG